MHVDLLLSLAPATQPKHQYLLLQVMASQKQMEAKFRQAQATSDDWLKRAELAVSKGEDELAREALKRRKAYQVRFHIVSWKV